MRTFIQKIATVLVFLPISIECIFFIYEYLKTLSGDDMSGFGFLQIIILPASLLMMVLGLIIKLIGYKQGYVSFKSNYVIAFIFLMMLLVSVFDLVYSIIIFIPSILIVFLYKHITDKENTKKWLALNAKLILFLFILFFTINSYKIYNYLHFYYIKNLNAVENIKQNNNIQENNNFTKKEVNTNPMGVEKVFYSEFSKENPIFDFNSCCTGVKYWYDSSQNNWLAVNIENIENTKEGITTPLTFNNQCSLLENFGINKFFKIPSGDEGVPKKYYYYLLTNKNFAFRFTSHYDLYKDYSSYEESIKPNAKLIKDSIYQLTNFELSQDLKSIEATCK